MRLGLGIGLSYPRSGGGAPAPTPVAGDVTAARIQPNGWVIEIDILGFKPGGNVGRGRRGSDGVYTGSTYTVQYDCGAFTVPKVLLATSGGAGFTSAGAASSTIGRSIPATIALRKPYSAGGDEQTNDETDNGTYTTIRLALADYVQPGETVTLGALADLYLDNGPGGSGATSRAVSGLAVVNNSGEALVTPIGGYLTPARQRLVTDKDFEFLPFHELGEQGRTVAAVVHSWTGATSGVTLSKTITTMVQSSFLDPTTGDRVACFKATLTTAEIAGFTQGEQVDWKCEPRAFVGLALVPATHGVAFPSPNYCASIPFICDKNDTLRAFATVDPAGVLTHNGTTGSTAGCSNTDIEQTNTANCYASHQDAANALFTFMGRSELSGAIIYTRAGTYTSWAGAGSNTSYAKARGQGWLTILPAPSTNRAGVIFSAASGQTITGAVRRIGGHVRIKGATLSMPATANANDNVILNGPDTTTTVAATAAAWIDGCIVTSQSTATTPSAIVAAFGQQYWTNNEVTLASANDSTFKVSAGRGYYLVAGNKLTNCQQVYVQGPVVGNRGLSQTAYVDYYGSAGVSFTPPTQVLLAFSSTSTSVPCNPGHLGSLTGVTYPRGVGWLQNLIESFGSASQPAASFSADRDKNELPNSCMAYCTILGQRTNGPYNSEGTTAVKKRHARRFNIFTAAFIKRDTFLDPVSGGGGSGKQAGRTGNWGPSHGVGSMGNVTIEAQFGYSLCAPESDIGDYLPGGKAVATVGFTDFKGGTHLGAGGGGTGGGTYTLSGSGDASNDAYNRVPAGLAMLPFDRAGVARKNDGKGAAGAYERTDI